MAAMTAVMHAPRSCRACGEIILFLDMQGVPFRRAVHLHGRVALILEGADHTGSGDAKGDRDPK
jgi:hypothetical protein